MRIERHFLPTPTPPRSLCWSGDTLVDAVSGGLRHGLNGESFDPCARSAHRFDAAVMSPDGRYTVLHERLGTHGWLLRDGERVRTLSRDSYQADMYEYPVALWTSPRGRTLLAHCPEDYCRLELEDAETGERLTRRETPSPDVFHSRLQFSHDGRFLLSAGWLWHPVDDARVFDVSRALEQPDSLDTPLEMALGEGFVELHQATFGARDTVLLECGDLDENEPGCHLVAYSLRERRLLSRPVLEGPLGRAMAVDAHHVLGFFQHPKLIEVATGRVVERWPELDTGRACGSITHHLPSQPPLALDAGGRRFAVGTETGIEVFRF